MTTCRVRSICLSSLLLLVVSGGCKRSENSQAAPAHPAAERAEAFLDALKYGDASQAAQIHIESTAAGFYCSREAFVDALEQARQATSQSECQRVKALTDEQQAGLPQESQLLIQIVRFTCKHPEAGCSEYGEHVLRTHLATQLEKSEYRWSMADWAFKKVIGDETGAVVYVDLQMSGSGDEVSHETLAMKHVAGAWYVSEPMLEQTSPRVP